MRLRTSNLKSADGLKEGGKGGRRVSWGHEMSGRAVASGRLNARGFTLVEATAVVIVGVVLAFLILVPALGCSRCSARQLKDSTQIRGIHQAMVVWAGNNSGSTFPLPSELDLKDASVGERGKAKDTTANIFSVLIYNSAISPELCVSPAEVSSKVELKTDYEYTAPKAAVLPSDALWDPSFYGTPNDAKRAMGFQMESSRGSVNGNQSYGHVIPVGRRLEQWKDTYAATTPILGNRGPTYLRRDFGSTSTNGQWKLLEGPLGTQSNTLRIHGGRTTWEGNIAFNDNHVTYETKPNPDSVTYKRRSGVIPTSTVDNLFVNESDEEAGDPRPGRFEQGMNAYLRAVWKLDVSGRAEVWRD